MKRIYKS